LPQDSERLAIQHDFGQILHVAEIEPEMGARLEPIRLSADALAIRGGAREVFHSLVRALAPGSQAIEVKLFWPASSRLEHDIPVLVQAIAGAGEQGLQRRRQLSRRLCRGLAEDNEDAPI